MKYHHQADYTLNFPFDDIVDGVEQDLTSVPVKVGYARVDYPMDVANMVGAVVVKDPPSGPDVAFFIRTTIGPSSAVTLEPGRWMTYAQTDGGSVFKTGLIEIY